MANTKRDARPDGTVVIGDSASMREIPDGSVHLVVTSPPYPMIGMWDGLFSSFDPEIDEKLSSDDRDSALKAYRLMHKRLLPTFKECARSLVDGGICCVNIGDAARTFGGRFQVFPNHAEMMMTLESCGLDMMPYILWKKPMNRPNAFLGSGFLPTNGYVTLDCEFILIARKGGPRRFEPKDPDRYSSSFTKSDRDRWFSQIWSDVRGASQSTADREARTGAFPQEIPRRLIRMFSVIGDTVLDPFMGTGTTLMESMALGRRFIGYEINESALSGEVFKIRGKDIAFIRRK